MLHVAGQDSRWDRNRRFKKLHAGALTLKPYSQLQTSCLVVAVCGCLSIVNDLIYIHSPIQL